MYRLIKPLLFRLPPEQAHHMTMSLWRTGLNLPGIGHFLRQQYQPTYSEDHLVRVFGLDFPNRVGLAAGFDKDGLYLREMAVIGFGFLEVGTVTPKPQVGNPTPRLFRLPTDRALINRMGFNNAGVDALTRRLQQWRTYLRDQPAPHPVLGGNIGKNKDTSNEEALRDYRYCFEQLFPYVDYFVVNVSSPNTPNLRALQDREPLYALLSALQSDNQGHATPRPILLKIAPDLSDAQLDDVLEIAAETQLAGLIATNTTISRAGLQAPDKQIATIGAGGLSGAPLRVRSTEVVRYLSDHADGQLPIIGVGGIDSIAAAKEKIDAGATLIQLYSGMIYNGPQLVHELAQSL